MPKRRVEFVTGEYYHIFNRGSGRQPIFCYAENCLFLLRLLKKYAQQFEIAVIAYCLMPNHYHLLVRQEGKVMAGRLPQYMFNSYTKAFNKQNERSGTLFQGPFKTVHVDKEAYLIHLCRYIHGNPVKSGIVSSMEQWPYSNYLEWIGKRSGTLFVPEFVNEHFATRAAYRTFVNDYLVGIDLLPDGLSAYVLE